MTATSLYRFYDAADQLLYVGITNQRTGRFRQHASSKVDSELKASGVGGIVNIDGDVVEYGGEVAW